MNNTIIQGISTQEIDRLRFDVQETEEWVHDDYYYVNGQINNLERNDINLEDEDESILYRQYLFNSDDIDLNTDEWDSNHHWNNLNYTYLEDTFSDVHVTSHWQIVNDENDIETIRRIVFREDLRTCSL